MFVYKCVYVADKWRVNVHMFVYKCVYVADKLHVVYKCVCGRQVTCGCPHVCVQVCLWKTGDMWMLTCVCVCCLDSYRGC